jgi:hypothetical protein
MGSRGDAYDNAVAETFFATLKKELVNRRSWPSRLELQSAVFEYIEAFYNRHSTLNMLSPANYEQLPALAARYLRTITRTTTINYLPTPCRANRGRSRYPVGVSRSRESDTARIGEGCAAHPPMGDDWTHAKRRRRRANAEVRVAD